MAHGLNSNIQFAGLLLAAGHSTRMGTDKALLPLDGLLLWQRQEKILRSTRIGELVFSVRPDQTWLPANRSAVLDKIPDLGPVSGLLAGLEVLRASHLIVLAVDLPQMSGSYLRKLMAQCKMKCGVVPVADGQYEPLAAIYPKQILSFIREAVERRELSLQSLIAQAVKLGLMLPLEIQDNQKPLFANWNEPGQTDNHRDTEAQSL